MASWHLRLKQLDRVDSMAVIKHYDSILVYAKVNGETRSRVPLIKKTKQKYGVSKTTK